MLGALFILQAGAVAAAATPVPASDVTLPTIELRARVHADSIRVERQGDAHLTVTADPLLDRAIDVRRSKPVPNARIAKNVDVDLDLHVTVDPNGGPPVIAAKLSSANGEPQP